MIKNLCLSARQKGALCFCAGLSPAVALLPRAAATPWGFLVPVGLLVLYLPPLLLLRRLPAEEGLLERLRRGAIGRFILAVLALWCLLLFSRLSGVVAQRVTQMAYPDVPAWFFVVLLSAGGIALSLCRCSTLGRMAELIFLTIGIGLLVTLPFSFSMGDWSLTVGTPNLEALGTGILWGITATAGLPFLLALFSPVDRQDSRRKTLLWSVALLCLVLAVLQLALLATFGPQGLLLLEDGFFTLFKGLRFFGAVERAEAVAVAVLVGGDLLLLAVLNHVAGSLLLAATGRLHQIFWCIFWGLAAMALGLWQPAGDVLLLYVGGGAWLLLCVAALIEGRKDPAS